MADFDYQAAARRLAEMLGQNGMPQLANQTVGMTPEGRPMIRNADGSYSTERTTTGPWGPGEQWTNIPTMFGGFEYPIEDAVAIMRASGWVDPDTGRQMQFFPSVDDAEREAAMRSMSHAMNMSPAPWARAGGR